MSGYYLINVFRAGSSLVLVLGLPEEMTKNSEEQILDDLGQLTIQTSVGRFQVVQEAVANCCDPRSSWIQIHLAGLRLPPGQHQVTIQGLQEEPVILEITVPPLVQAA